jgi:hypothetical protein
MKAETSITKGALGQMEIGNQRINRFVGETWLDENRRRFVLVG